MKTTKNSSKKKLYTKVFCEICGLDVFFASKYRYGSMCIDCRSLQLTKAIQCIIEEVSFLRSKVIDIKWQLKQMEIDLRKSNVEF